MTLLFDISPDEPTRGGKRKPAPLPQAAEGASVAISESRPMPQRALLPLGKLDHTYQCADKRCRAECHDILHEDGREWLISCCFCGTAQWVRVIAGHLPPEDNFVLRDGRFAGLTLAEVAREPRGQDYIAWAAESHPRKPVREAAKRHLVAKAATC